MKRTRFSALALRDEDVDEYTLVASLEATSYTTAVAVYRLVLWPCGKGLKPIRFRTCAPSTLSLFSGPPRSKACSPN